MNLIKFTQDDLDSMIDIFVNSKGDLKNAIAEYVIKGYEDDVIIAFFKSIVAVYDELIKDDLTQTRLAAIKIYILMRINVALMDDDFNASEMTADELKEEIAKIRKK